jgi:hypothetical protein
MVPKAGLEPARLTPPPPQDGVSTNSTTSAFSYYNYLAYYLSLVLLSTGTGIEFTGTLVCNGAA